MTKELEDLLIEFDEMGFEPTTLVPNQEEAIKQFRNKLQALKQFIEGNCGEDVKKALKILKDVSTAMNYPNKYLGYSSAKMAFDEDIVVIEQALQHKSIAERCWEIAIKRNVEINWFTTFKGTEFYTYEYYVSSHKGTELIEVEFETLKEGLK